MSHVAAIVVTYKDGTQTGQVVHRGDRGSCEAIRLPAVAASRTDAVAAEILVVTEEEWQAAGGSPPSRSGSEPPGEKR